MAFEGEVGSMLICMYYGLLQSLSDSAPGSVVRPKSVNGLSFRKPSEKVELSGYSTSRMTGSAQPSATLRAKKKGRIAV
jgi:hypothetical protein